MSTVHDGPLLHLFADRCCLLEFEFPITDLGEDMLPNIESLGHHLPRIYPSGNPMNTPEIQDFMKGYKEGRQGDWQNSVEKLIATNPNPSTFSQDQISIIERVPSDSGLRIVVDPAQ